MTSSVALPSRCCARAAAWWPTPARRSIRGAHERPKSPERRSSRGHFLCEENPAGTMSWPRRFGIALHQLRVLLGAQRHRCQALSFEFCNRQAHDGPVNLSLRRELASGRLIHGRWRCALDSRALLEPLLLGPQARKASCRVGVGRDFDALTSRDQVTRSASGEHLGLHFSARTLDTLRHLGLGK